MNKRIWGALALGLALLAGCARQTELPAVTQSPTQATTVPTEPITPTTQPMLQGWQEEGDDRMYYRDGEALAGWLDLDGGTYFLAQGRGAVTGWATIAGGTYYFDSQGLLCTGWLDLDGSRYYLSGDGTLRSGWTELDGALYCFREDGAVLTGWQDRDGDRYYLTESGAAAVGALDIDGETFYFSPHGVQVLLVNPWNYLPQDYEVELVSAQGGFQIAGECADALAQMLQDCREAGCRPVLRSAYRTWADQRYLHNRRIQRYRDQGYSKAEAERLAGQSVAVPGTSEHQLGLAVDLVDYYNQSMTASQESTKTQQWLLEHCWEYGFILRYPNGTTDITGIIYEPWHYRYVGVDMALELRDLGITLEEYLGFVPPEA